MSSRDSDIRAAQAGDHGAFERLARREGPRLFAIAARVLRDRDLAEDAVQETFLRVVEGRAPVRERGAAASWLTRVVTRVAIDIARRRDARRRREEGHAMARKKESPKPVDRLLSDEARAALDDALSVLPLETRAALWLHVVEGEGVREIAGCLGSSRSTVSRRIRSGLANLRTAMERRGHAPPTASALVMLLRDLPQPEPPSTLAARLVQVVERCRRPAPYGKAPERARPSRRLRRRDIPTRFVVLSGAILLVGLALTAVWRATRDGSVELGDPRIAEMADVEGTDRATSPPAGADRGASEPASTPPEAAPIEPPEVLRGRVLDTGGGPVARADVLVWPDLAPADPYDLLSGWRWVDAVERLLEPVEPVARVVADEEGRFEIPVADDEAWVLHARAEISGEVLAGATRTAVRRGAEGNGEEGNGEEGNSEEGNGEEGNGEEGNGEEWTVTLGPALRVSGSVVDPEGRALQGARVVAVPDPTLWVDRADFTATDVLRLLERFVPLQATTDASGRFRLEGLPLGEAGLESGRFAGTLQVLARAPGRVIGRHRVDGRDSGLAAEVEIALPSALEVPGIARLAGQTSGGVPARVAVFEDPTDHAGWLAVARCSDDGRFHLRVPPGEPFEAMAGLEGRLRPATAGWDPAAGRARLEIVFGGRGSIRGTVRYAGGGTVEAGTRIICRDFAGAFVSSQSTTDEAGRYRIEGLPFERTFHVFVEKHGFCPRKPESPVPSPERTEVVHEIELIPTLSLRGVVLDASGEPQPDALVEPAVVARTDIEGLYLRWRDEVLALGGTETDSRGRFVLDDLLPAERVFVWAYHPDGGEAFSEPLDLYHEDPPASLRIRLDDARLELGLFTRSGEPFHDTRVDLQIDLYSDWIPDRVDIAQWMRRFTSLDVSRFELEHGITPGFVRGGFPEDGTARFHGLMATEYRIWMEKAWMEKGKTVGAPFGAPGAERPITWTWSATLAEPLRPRAMTSLRLELDTSRRFVGVVVDRDGRPLPGLDVTVVYEWTPVDGLKDAAGHFKTNTNVEGAFGAVAIGPAPYRVIVSDREGRGLEFSPVPASPPGTGKAVTFTFDPP